MPFIGERKEFRPYTNPDNPNELRIGAACIHCSRQGIDHERVEVPCTDCKGTGEQARPLVFLPGVSRLVPCDNCKGKKVVVRMYCPTIRLNPVSLQLAKEAMKLAGENPGRAVTITGDKIALEPGPAAKPDPNSNEAILARHRKASRREWETFVREKGFDSIEDYNRLALGIVTDTEAKFQCLLEWRVRDGTKTGLLALIEGGKL